MKKITLLILLCASTLLMNAQTFDFKTAQAALGWELQYAGGRSLTIVSEGMELGWEADNSLALIHENLGINADLNKYLHLTISNNSTEFDKLRISHPREGGTRYANFVVETNKPEFTTYVFDMSHSSWTGTIDKFNYFAFQVSTGGKLQISSTIVIQKIEFLDTDVLATENISRNDKSVLVYPNPATGILNYRAENVTTLMIFNILGQQVLEAKKATGSIDVSGLNSGMYILKLKGENGAVSTKKFSVK